MNRVGGVTMANIKSAKKRVRVNAVKAEQNKALKSEPKTAIKKADLAIVNGDENRAEAVKAAVKKIDQACAKGLLPKNNASRKKANLAAKLAANA